MTIQIHYWSVDVERLLQHYVQILGFELVHRQPVDPPANFCILGLEGAQFMIGSNPDGLAKLDRNDRAVLEAAAARLGHTGPVSVYIGVASLDAYYARLVERAACIVEPIWDAPWGQRQFSARDVDGNLMTFFQSETAG